MRLPRISASGNGNDIRQITGIQALPVVGQEFSTTRHATTNPMSQGEKSCQRPQHTGICKEDFEASGLKSICGSCKNCKTYFNVHSVHLRGSGEALQIGYVFSVTIGCMLVAMLFWKYGLPLLPSYQDIHESFKGFSQTLKAYKGEEASIKARNEARSDGHGVVIGRIWGVLRSLAYHWNSDPDWYSGSILSKIIPALRDVSLYALAILLAAYVVILEHRDDRAQFVVQGSPSVLISTASRKR